MYGVREKAERRKGVLIRGKSQSRRQFEPEGLQWMDTLSETLTLEAFVKGNCSLRNPKFLYGFVNGLTTGQGSVSTRHVLLLLYTSSL